MKRRSIKTNRPLVEQKTVTVIIYNTMEIGVCFLLRLHPKLRKIRKKSGIAQKLTDNFLKQI